MVFLVGQRVAIGKDVATIRFVGPVEGTPGLWLGLEWDDAGRGKHSGSKDGRHYFDVGVAGSGSFVRPSARVSAGHSFVDTFKARYGGGSESDQTFSDASLPAKIVTVGLEKVGRRIAEWSRLTALGLEASCTSSAGPAEELAALGGMMLNVTSVDLSDNLLATFEEVVKLAGAIPCLETLVLNGNRLAYNMESDWRHVQHLRHLHLSRTAVHAKWGQMAQILGALPRLETFDCSRCNVELPSAPSLLQHRQLQELDLNTNNIGEWDALLAALQSLPRLKTLNIASNRLPDLPNDQETSLPSIKVMSLSKNCLTFWPSLDRLILIFPSLSRLAISASSRSNGQQLRPGSVAMQRRCIGPESSPSPGAPTQERRGIPDTVSSSRDTAHRHRRRRVQIRGSSVSLFSSPLYDLLELEYAASQVRTKLQKVIGWDSGPATTRLFAILRPVDGEEGEPAARKEEMVDAAAPLEFYGLADGDAIEVLQ